MTPRELANEHSRKHNARTTSGGSDAPKKIQELQDRINRLEEAGDELLRDNEDMANINRWHKAKEEK